MTDTPFGLRTIGQILVPVTDIERATAFYRDVLGMRFLYAYPGIAFFDCDGVRLYLADPVEAFRGRAVLYFSVPSVPEAFETLTGRGATAVSEPRITHRADTYDLWMAFVRDPDDNQIGVMAEVPRTT
jgi:catechol 2,3-dioxygenase-like lactoylglutathione lyase family enzyme